MTAFDVTLVGQTEAQLERDDCFKLFVSVESSTSVLTECVVEQIVDTDLNRYVVASVVEVPETLRIRFKRGSKKGRATASFLTELSQAGEGAREVSATVYRIGPVDLVPIAPGGLSDEEETYFQELDTDWTAFGFLDRIRVRTKGEGVAFEKLEEFDLEPVGAILDGGKLPVTLKDLMEGLGVSEDRMMDTLRTLENVEAEVLTESSPRLMAAFVTKEGEGEEAC